jgi:DMSO/TMAO reductase YedYZ molybdopterin-dependent catalytic subunit
MRDFTYNPGAAAAVVVALALFFAAGPAHSGQAPAVSTGPAELKISGSVETPLTLTAAELKKMPRKTLSVVNPHEKKTEVYEGVALAELLHRAGAPQGAQLRGPAMASYVLAEAADGYRVVFSLAELDSDFLESEVIVADTVDGGPLGPNQGPFRIVAPHDKRPARWIRMLKSLTVVKAPN